MNKNLRASILGISRDEKLFIPKKQDILLQGDHVYILVDKNHVKRTMSAFGYDEKPIKKIIIISNLYIKKKNLTFASPWNRLIYYFS